MCYPSKSRALVAACCSLASAYFAVGTGFADPRDDQLRSDSPPAQEEAPRFPPVWPTHRITAPPCTPEELRLGRYQSIQVNVDPNGMNIVGDAANEPSIAVDPTNPNRIVIGWRQFNSIQSDFRQAGWAYSRDAGRHWTFPGVLENNVFRSDPVLAADADGVFYYYSLRNTNPYTCQTFISSYGGATWLGPISAHGGDKAWTAIDRTGGLGHGNFYAAWDYAGCCGDNWFTRSVDGGLTYMNPIPLPNQPYWGTVAIGPTGQVYVVGGFNGTSNYRFLRSSNAKDPNVTPTFDLNVAVNLGGAMRFNLGYGPNPGGLIGQVWVAADTSGGATNGYIYMLFSCDPNGTDPADVKFTRSTNGGSTWSSSTRINTDPNNSNNWQWFGTLSVAPNGRLDVIWNDTRGTGSEHVSAVYYSYSTDAGLTWSPNEPITPTFDSWLGWPQQNKLGDYVHMLSDNVGASLAYAATFNGEQDIYYLRIGDYDCNGNGVADPQDIAVGTSTDFNGNGIPDECDGLGDLNCDGAVNFDDINPFVLALSDPVAYQQAFPNCPFAKRDINGDGTFDFDDINGFVAVLSH
jgi:hypothetical protein